MLVLWIARYQVPCPTLLVEPPSPTPPRSQLDAAVSKFVEKARQPLQPQLPPKTPMPKRAPPFLDRRFLDTRKLAPPPLLPAAAAAGALPHPPAGQPPLSALARALPHPPKGPPPPTTTSAAVASKARPPPAMPAAAAETVLAGAAVTGPKSLPTPDMGSPGHPKPPGSPPLAVIPAGDAASAPNNVAKKARSEALKTINTTKIGTVIYEGVLEVHNGGDICHRSLPMGRQTITGLQHRRTQQLINVRMHQTHFRSGAREFNTCRRGPAGALVGTHDPG
jgi:hypothetical protein